MDQQHNFHNGFALLYAILLTGAVLTIGVILMNIIVKQLVYSSVNRESEVSYYYVANSVRECLRRNINGGEFVTRTKPPGKIYSPKQTVHLNCFSGVGIDLSSPVDNGGVYSYQADALPIMINERTHYVGIKVDVNIKKLNGQSSNSDTISDNYSYLAIADGYSQNPASGNTRLTKRSAVYAK